MILTRSGTHPDEIALDDGTRRRSWRELEERLHRIAHWLRDDLALPSQAHVAVLMDNRVEAVEVVIGAMLAGLWITPVNRHLRAEEIAHVLTDSGARLVVTDEAHASRRARRRALRRSSWPATHSSARSPRPTPHRSIPRAPPAAR